MIETHEHAGEFKEPWCRANKIFGTFCENSSNHRLIRGRPTVRSHDREPRHNCISGCNFTLQPLLQGLEIAERVNGQVEFLNLWSDAVNNIGNPAVKSGSCPNSISNRILGAGSPASWKALCRAGPISMFTPDRTETSCSRETAADHSGK